MTNENHNDEKTKFANGKDVLRWIVGLICFVVVPIGFVYFFAWLLPVEGTGDAGRKAVGILAQIPTKPWFYALVGALVGGYLAWSWHRHADLHKEFEEKEKEYESKEKGREKAGNKDGLTRHDWWIAYKLRKRALTLRLQANLVMGGVFALLGGGVYLVLFVLPEIEISDQLIAKKIQFEERFGQSLQSIVDGRYWLNTDEPDKKVGSNADDKTGLVKDPRVSVFMRTDGGQSNPSSLPLQPREEVIAAAFSADGKTGLVVDHKVSVFMRTDGGQSNPSSLLLQPREDATAAAFSADGKTGLVAGDEGSVLMTTDGGQNWVPTEGLHTEGLDPKSYLDEVRASHSYGGYIAQTKDGDYYRLKAHPELKEWRKWSITGIRREMMKDKELRGSQILKYIRRFDDEFSDSGANRERDSNGEKERKEGFFGGLLNLNNLTVMRIATLTVLFFLVQILVRLYQYSLRLSAFWESRADAVFLARSFAEKRRKGSTIWLACWDPMRTISSLRPSHRLTYPSYSRRLDPI